MGGVTLITEGTSTGRITTTELVSDGDGSRIFAWASAPENFGAPVVTGQDQHGNDVTRPPTPDEVQARYLRNILATTLETNVRRWEKKRDIEAVPEPADFTLTSGDKSWIPPE